MTRKPEPEHPVEPTVSLIITTYNNPDFLRLSMRSLFGQSLYPLEVIIADDGSTDDTKRLIDELRTTSPVPIVHVWQPDNGFQAGRIRNIAIAAARGVYIIQIDGDIVMHRDFIRDHVHHREPRTILEGSRILLTPEKTHSMIDAQQTMIHFFSRGINHRIKTLRSRWLSNRLISRNGRKGQPLYITKGCNMSYWRQDFIDVNGYDHNITGWGHEDCELVIRMLNSGCGKSIIKLNCMAYHLYHHENTREFEGENRIKMETSYREGKKWCDSGIAEFLTDPQAHTVK